LIQNPPERVDNFVRPPPVEHVASDTMPIRDGPQGDGTFGALRTTWRHLAATDGWSTRVTSAAEPIIAVMDETRAGEVTFGDLEMS
jgi:hypothetical protein